MQYRLGCNTLYPFGRLKNVQEQFGMDAQKEALRVIRDTGFDGCEFSHYECLSLSACGELRQHCAALTLEPWSAHSWVTLPATPVDAKTQLPALTQTLDAAAALGARVMVVHAQRGDPGLEETLRRQRRSEGLEHCLLHLSDAAADAGLRIAVENCGDLADLEFLVETVTNLSRDNVGLNVDTGHAVLHGMTPQQVIYTMGERLFTTHLQDNFGQRDDHLPPGSGTIDWPPVIDAFREVNYQGMLMIEISDCPPGREPDATADTHEAFANLRRFVEGRSLSPTE